MSLGSKDRGVLRRRSYFAQVGSACGGNLHIERHGVIVGVDDRVVCRLVRGDVDCSTGEQMLLASEERCVPLACVRWCKENKVPVDSDQLHLSDDVRVLLEEVDLRKECFLVRCGGSIDVCSSFVHERRCGSCVADKSRQSEVCQAGNGLIKYAGRVACIERALLLLERGIVVQGVKGDSAGILAFPDTCGVGMVLEILAAITDASIAEYRITQCMTYTLVRFTTWVTPALDRTKGEPIPESSRI